MPKTFYIIDGHAHIFRAYFAPFRDLRGPNGEPTKATFVFTQMLLSLIERRRPEYLAMVIDSGDESVFRKEIYADYKANRQSPPDDFGPQAQRIIEIVKDAGIPIFVKPGFEADDLIATIAERLCDQDFEIMLVSKDKDLRQLLNDCTKMYDVQKDEVIDVARMIEEQGYTPQQAIDVQTLTGDAVDNVPGIPGVGEKTAAKLLQKYGTVDGILQHLDELTPKLRENLQKHADKLPLARQLVTLKRDVDFDFDVECCKFGGVDADALRKHFTELGFGGLLRRLEGDGAAVKKPERPAVTQTDASPERIADSLFSHLPEPAVVPAHPCISSAGDCDYRLVDTEEKFDQFLAALKGQKRFAFDTETDVLGAMCSNLVGLSFSWEKRKGFYVPVRGPADQPHLSADRVLEALKPILEDESVRKIGHNIKYDMLVMRCAGIELRGVVLDTMIAAFLADAGRIQYGIDALARGLLSYQKIPTIDLIGRGKKQVSMDKVDLNAVAQYASEDADVALQLAEILSPKLDEVPALRALNDELETPLIDVLVEMETNGVAIDPQILKEQSQVLGERIDKLRGQIVQQAGTEFNPDSPKQLAEVLFNKLNLRVIKRTKTGPSTDVEVLERLAADHNVPKLVLEYRSLVKLKNTYLDNLTAYVNERTGRIHASFNQTGAATGRLSCSDPNLQNIPIRTDEGHRIRLAFVPGDREKNVLLTADYSQIELRVLAHFTLEPALVRAFEQDEDIHRAVAAEVFGVAPDQVTREQRGQAKTINFGIVYGVTPAGLARRIGGLTTKAAGELIQAYNKRFPSIEQFLNQCVMQAQSHGYVETMLGRRRPITEIHSQVLAIRNAAERMAINSVIQGTAADMIKRAMLNVYRRIKDESRPSKLLLQVHDELVFETPAASVESEAAMVREEMINAMDLRVPIKVEVGWGKNWQEVK